MSQTAVFVLPADHGHFDYTVHLACALRGEGLAVEYWAPEKARGYAPECAQFHSLGGRDILRFIDTYCRAVSTLDDDAASLRLAPEGLSVALRETFPPDGVVPYSDGDAATALKERLLRPDVVLCVCDATHVYSWAADHCATACVPCLRLHPTAHKEFRERAGTLELWQQAFAGVTWGVPESVTEPVPTRSCSAPSADLQVIFRPMVAQLQLPEGLKSAGPVYAADGSPFFEAQAKQLADSGLLSWLESSPSPVVFVSLGSMIGSSRPDVAAKLLHALASSSSWRVLAALEPKVAEGLQLPETVRLAGWVPQFAVLGHRQVKAFVTHCGSNSLQEAVYHAVPMVGVPFFDDQLYNAPRLVELGLSSATLMKSSFTEEQLVDAVQAAMGADFALRLQEASKEAKAAGGLATLVAEAETLIAWSRDHPTS